MNPQTHPVSDWRRALAVVSATLWLTLMLVAGLQQRLCPIFSVGTWSAVSRKLPNLAFGYVMFDRVPRSLTYYELTADGQLVAPRDIDRNGSWGYEDARFQINALLLDGYVESTCTHASRDFQARRIQRDLVDQTEHVVSITRCASRRWQLVTDRAP